MISGMTLDLNKLKLVAAASLALGATLASVSVAEEGTAPATDLVVNEANSLDELLKNVEERRVESQRTLLASVVLLTKRQNARLLKAEAERLREQHRSDRLETQFEENEIRIGDLTEQLDKVWVACASYSVCCSKLPAIPAVVLRLDHFSQYADRGDWLGELAKKMGTASQLATIDEMESLWFELQREMTESGKSLSTGTITKLSGDKVDTEIVVGSFALIGEGQYLQWDADSQSISELARQTTGRHVSTAEDLQAAAPGEVVEFSVDPTRGSLLALLIQAATLGERIGSPFAAIGECGLPFCDGQGGEVGSVIILGGILGVLLALERFITLFLIGNKVAAQRKDPVAQDDNPLGRVLKVYEENKDVDVETLELKLGEAILTETPALTKYINLVQVISVVAPLTGLLGTVIGMIETFQAITLFGTGDPKTMASGISKALMTTVLGCGDPTTLLHAVVSSQSRGLVHIIEEQSAVCADHAEKSGKTLG